VRADALTISHQRPPLCTMAPRALILRLSRVGFLVYGALLACNSAAQQARLVYVESDLRLAGRDAAPEAVTMVLGITGTSEIPLAEGAADEQTVVAVDEDSFEESSAALRFVLETTGNETLGARVVLDAPEADGDAPTYLGLRGADRIEEIEGLPIAGLDALEKAWQGVGRRPEVRFLITREGQPHTIIYRRRATASDPVRARGTPSAAPGWRKGDRAYPLRRAALGRPQSEPGRDARAGQ